MKKTLSLYLLFILLIPVSVFSHGAMEYIELDGFETGIKGESCFHLHYDYMVDDNTKAELDHWEITPGVSYSFTSFLMADIHVHFAQFSAGHIVEDEAVNYPLGSPAMMEAAAIAVQSKVIDSFIQIGMSIGYEAPFQRAKVLLDGKQVGSFTLVMAKEFSGHKNITFNFTIEKEEGVNTALACGLGGKTPLTGDEHGVAAGLEFHGIIPTDDESVSMGIMPGIYLPFAENIIVKSGIGVNYDFDAKKGKELHYSASMFYSF